MRFMAAYANSQSTREARTTTTDRQEDGFLISLSIPGESH